MPITKTDVLDVLNDPRLANMNFSVGPITVNAEEYRNVAAYIEAGDIRVIPGAEPIAYYDGRLNTIETPAGNPPLNLGQRAQLLHECTHAIVDIDRLHVLVLDDEVAAYIAQLTYMWIASPGPFPRPIPPATLGPLMRLMTAVAQIIQRYELHTSKGIGARISELDVAGLRRAVHAVPAYRNIKPAQTNNAQNLGVPASDANNQIGRLQHAIALGQRGRTRTATYTPSPRLDIF